MKKLLFLAALLVAATSNAQVYTETFDTNDLGWTEMAGDDGEALIINGVMHMEGKKNGGKTIFGVERTSSSIETHCYAPIDVTRDFEISCEAQVKKITDSNTFGLIIDYLDDMNFVVFTLSEGRACVYRFKEDKLIGSFGNDIKLPSQKKAEVKLTIKSTLNKIEFFVNDMKALEYRYLSLISNGVGFYVLGKQTVDFDNLQIIQ